MMSPKFERFASAVRDYAKFKAQFRSFCEMSAQALNSNPELPGTSFVADPEGNTAVIRFLDQKFVVRFSVVALDDARIGLLEVFLPTPKDEEVPLWHTFFDILGNVRDTPDAPSAVYGVREKQFLERLLGEFPDRYFSHRLEKFKASAPPPRLAR